MQKNPTDKAVYSRSGIELQSFYTDSDIPEEHRSRVASRRPTIEASTHRATAVNLGGFFNSVDSVSLKTRMSGSNFC